MMDRYKFMMIKIKKIYSSEVDIDKNVLIVVRSFASQFPARVYKIEN